MIRIRVYPQYGTRNARSFRMRQQRALRHDLRAQRMQLAQLRHAMAMSARPMPLMQSYAGTMSWPGAAGYPRPLGYGSPLGYAGVGAGYVAQTLSGAPWSAPYGASYGAASYGAPYGSAYGC